MFGSPDDMKFRSCMTLFSLATDDPDNPFRQALERWCGDCPDERTLALIDAGGSPVDAARLVERGGVSRCDRTTAP